jgi:hypothetical protein
MDDRHTPDEYSLPEDHPFGGEYGEITSAAYNIILGHHREEPCMEEIMYILGERHEEEKVQQGLRELQHDGIIKTTVMPEDYHQDGLPSTFYTFTDSHERDPDPLRGADPAGVEAFWTALYEHMEKTDRIEALEQTPRPRDYPPDERKTSDTNRGV